MLQNYQDIKLYDKLHKKIFNVIETLFRNHLELVFFKFDFQTIQQLLLIVNEGVKDECFEVNQAACSALVFFNEYMYTQLKHPKIKKQPLLT